MPLVTAVITTFNRKAFLNQAIQSVLGQSFNDYELIVLDNNSTDGTEELVKTIIHPRIKYLKHKNINISQQRNLAISLAKGKYIAFLDDDDVWLPNKLNSQLNKFAQGNDMLSLVYGGYYFYNDKGKNWGRYYPNLKGFILVDLLWATNSFTGSASNPLIDLKKLKNVGGFDNSISAGEDWEVYLRLAGKYEIDYVDELVLKIRQHNGLRLGGNINYSLFTEKKVLSKYKKIMPKKMLSLYCQRIGGKLIRLGDKKNGRLFLSKALFSNPLNFIGSFQYFLSFFPTKLYIEAHKFFIHLRKAI